MVSICGCGQVHSCRLRVTTGAGAGAGTDTDAGYGPQGIRMCGTDTDEVVRIMVRAKVVRTTGDTAVWYGYATRHTDV